MMQLRARCFSGLIVPFSLLVILLGFCATDSGAQTFFGSIVGAVTDNAAGNNISGATVTLTSVATSGQWTVTTDSNGNYEFVNLVPGTYKLDFEKTGFKHLKREPVTVEVQKAVRIDVALFVGDVTEVVTITAEAPLVDTQTASLSQIVQGRAVEELPLNGRNVLNLVELTPGVVPQGAASGSTQSNQRGGKFTNPNGWGNYQIGGGNAGQSATLVDGASVNTTYINSTTLIPTQDAIQEFRVATNNVSPEFGRFAGGIVNMTTKSGSNLFHGNVYDYLRNKVLNANDFFNNAANPRVPRPDFVQNQYGVNLGGPILKEKVFFFFGWEGLGLRKGLPTHTTVPTDAERKGDFSAEAPIKDPTTGMQFQCNGVLNVICPDRFDPTSVATLDFWGPATDKTKEIDNFNQNTKVGGNQNQYNARVDYRLSDKQLIFGRYTHWAGITISYNPFKNATGFPTSSYNSQQVVLGDTYAFDAKTVSDFRISYLRFVYGAIPVSAGTDLSTFGPNWASLNNQVLLRTAPLPLVSGFADELFQFMNVSIPSTNNDYAISGNLTKIVGRHTLKFGGEGRRLDWYFSQSIFGAGAFSFIPFFTGNSFADYLIGKPFLRGSDQGSRVSSPQIYQGYYFADTFQVSHKLTLNYGVRWELPGAFEEAKDKATVLLPNALDPLGAAVGPVNGNQLTGQLALVNSPLWHDRHTQSVRYGLFAPRVGLAYSIDPKTVIRAGYGINYIPNDVAFDAGPWRSPINNTFSTPLFFNLPSSFSYSNPYPDGLLKPGGRSQTYVNSLEGGSVASPVPNQPYPYVQQWNLNIQRQVGAGAILQVGYAAAKGTHLTFDNLELNQLPNKYDSMGDALFTQVANPFAGKLPGSSLNGATIAQGQLLLPHPQFTSFAGRGLNAGSSTYHALQATFEKRLPFGATVLASYSWSKFISDVDSLQDFLEHGTPGVVQNSADLRAEKSLTSYDVPQRLVLGYTVDLPFGKGRKWLGNIAGFSDKMVSGWGIGGITTFQSGFPLALSLASHPHDASGFGLDFFNVGPERPNVVSGCDKSASGSAQSRLNAWFNTACFVSPDPFGFGSESRTDSSLRSAGINNWDFSIFKNTTVSERYRIEFRAEIFNVANRVQFGPPGTQMGIPTFGVVSEQINEPRLIQFALRFKF
jgi:hypothetical protein